MICRHCGKEYSDEFAYCPYCAEPKYDKKPKIEKYHHWGNAGFKIIIGMVILLFFSFIYALFHSAINSDGNTIDESELLSTFLYLYIPLQIIHIIGVIVKYKNKKNRLIMEQFHYDKLGVCPKCGSHNIKIYRKGYNYNKGFWLRMFDIKGGGYIAGMDSNNTCCRCMNCGNDWETDYDYRLINK